MSARLFEAQAAPSEEQLRSHLVVRNTFFELVEDERQPLYRRSQTDTLLQDRREDIYGSCCSDEDTALSEDAAPSEDTAKLYGHHFRMAAEVDGQVAQSSEATGKKGCGQPPGRAKTTLMLRNVPNNYTRDMLLELLDGEGFKGEYDFVYLPMDFKSSANLGYAFVNVASPSKVHHFWAALDGYKEWTIPTAKVCQVGWSDPHQGLRANVHRYRNSPVMHEDVPDECKPVLFAHGIRTDFPNPTKSLHAPRRRGRH